MTQLRKIQRKHVGKALNGHLLLDTYKTPRGRKFLLFDGLETYAALVTEEDPQWKQHVQVTGTGVEIVAPAEVNVGDWVYFPRPGMVGIHGTVAATESWGYMQGNTSYELTSLEVGTGTTLILRGGRAYSFVEDYPLFRDLSPFPVSAHPRIPG